jgi:DNA repair photolyase
MATPIHRRGRGAALNPPNRFDRFHVEEEPAEISESERRSVPTRFIRDASRSVLARNESPDVPFTYSLNPYRGCEHGCVYCYARPSHEYLGFSAGLDFETRIVVKYDAPEKLARQFEDPGWVPQVVALSGNTDPYQPVERRLELTRACLEVFLRYRNPVSIVTKNHLITRDIDILGEMAQKNLVGVMVSVTSLQDDLVSAMEPRTSRPSRRLEAIRELVSAGIPTGVLVAPVIPGLTDEELPAILKATREAGAKVAAWIPLRLPGAVETIFEEWLDREHPDRADKIRSRVRSIRGGAMNDSRFGVRMTGEGRWAEILGNLFRTTADQLGFNHEVEGLSTEHFTRSQRELFQLQ